ncbi:MAG TPA: hypothetical protein VKU19_21055 [Bryobacteraceae bacterium]|nr:hypothetical protein [Bryobacteraceae bacterium]
MQKRGVKAAIVLLFTAYFLFVTHDGLHAPFAADDMQAIHIYFHPSPVRFFVSQIMLWRGYFRPMNGFFYLPLFLTRGLDPAPYHAVLLVLLWIGAYQLYRLARALGADEWTAAAAALIACYHGGMANLYYNTVYVGDVFCGIFYWATLALYAGVRGKGGLLSRWQMTAFLLLYLCALNSKEMALTLPAMLLAYEWLFHGVPPRQWKELREWLGGPGRGFCFAALLDAICVYGKAFGSYGLMKNPAYRPVYSWARFADFQERYLSNLFYQVERLNGWATLAIWVVVTYMAWRRNRPVLRFCWFYVLLTPIPVMFLIGREQANLYVTLAGWALLAATLFTDWLRSAARVISEEPLFRRIGEARAHALLYALGLLAAAYGAWSFKEKWIVSAIPKLSPVTAQAISQFQAVKPKLRPGGTVIFLDDPWHGGFDMALIAELWFRDRKVQVYLNQQTPVTPAEIAKADAVFTWTNDALVPVSPDPAIPGH